MHKLPVVLKQQQKYHQASSKNAKSVFVTAYMKYNNFVSLECGMRFSSRPLSSLIKTCDNEGSLC